MARTLAFACLGGLNILTVNLYLAMPHLAHSNRSQDCSEGGDWSDETQPISKDNTVSEIKHWTHLRGSLFVTIKNTMIGVLN